MPEKSLAVLPKNLPANKFPKSGNVGPQFVKRIMPWFESFWHEHHRYPEHSEIMQKFGFSMEQVDKLNTHKFWLKALDARGITRPGRNDLYLNDRQIAAVAILTNFSDTRPVASKLANAGISMEELNGWYKNPKFNEELSRRAEDVLQVSQPMAKAELARQVARGHFPALKFYMEITGQVQTQEQINLRQSVQILVEAVQKHVTDPATLRAISEEVESLRKIQGLT